MSPGEIEQREMRKLDQMADMGVAVVGEREGQFAQLRLAGAEGEEVVVEQTPRIVVQPGCAKRLVERRNRHEIPHLLRARSEVTQHIVYVAARGNA